MTTLLVLAGMGQLLLAFGSLAIPRILAWKEDTSRLRPLTRQVFWTYAGYIWATNVAFGLVSVAAPHWLLDGSGLARAVTGYVTLYWGARLCVQLFYFDRSSAPAGALYRAAEALLVGLFVFLTAVYGWLSIA
jgi:hypothetical protein